MQNAEILGQPQVRRDLDRQGGEPPGLSLKRDPITGEQRFNRPVAEGNDLAIDANLGRHVQVSQFQGQQTHFAQVHASGDQNLAWGDIHHNAPARIDEQYIAMPGAHTQRQ